MTPEGAVFWADIAARIALPAGAARWFLPFVAPICLWVAWSDMARMKIPNRAVLCLAGVYLVIGPIALPLDDYAWGWLRLAVVLAAGFVLNLAGAFGAGDAKFAAAAAPFVALADTGAVLVLLAVLLVAGLVTHRGARRIPALRDRAPHWTSWSSPKFPMGLALGPALALYLALAATG